MLQVHKISITVLTCEQQGSSYKNNQVKHTSTIKNYNHNFNKLSEFAVYYSITLMTMSYMKIKNKFYIFIFLFTYIFLFIYLIYFIFN
jgi:hypothetical protein